MTTVPWKDALRSKLRERIAKLSVLAEEIDVGRGAQWNKLTGMLHDLALWTNRVRCEQCGKESKVIAHAAQEKGWFFHCGSFNPRTLCPACVKKTPKEFFDKAAPWTY